MGSKEERFNLRDVLQTSVGAFTGALASFEFWRYGDGLPATNALLMVALSLLLAFLIAYYLGVRRLGHRHIKMLLGFLPERISAHYLLALFCSAVVLYTFGVNSLQTPLTDAVNRIVVVALPATALGSAVDLIDSQRSD